MFAFICWCVGMVARLRALLNVGSADDSSVCVAGKGIFEWAGTNFINDEGALVSCGLGGQLFNGGDANYNSFWRLEEFNWVVYGCLGLYKSDFWTGAVRVVPAYQRHEKVFPKLNPAY